MTGSAGASGIPGNNFGHGILDHPPSRVMTTIGILTMPRHHQKKTSAAGGSQRQLRVGELVRHAIAEILVNGSVHDPDLEGHIITVPEVRMSPDLKLATIYVMPLGGRDTDKVIAALERNKKFLRGEVARRVNLKFAPDVRFRADDRFDEAERIEKLLRTPAVQRDLAPDSQDSEE
jgi:ribosome-binding factor A